MFSHIHPFLWPLPRLGYLAGVVPKVDEARFARALWRAARGNTFAWHGGTGCGVGDGPWAFYGFLVFHMGILRCKSHETPSLGLI